MGLSRVLELVELRAEVSKLLWVLVLKKKLSLRHLSQLKRRSPRFLLLMVMLQPLLLSNGKI
ncbi:unnamed protein product [Coffea canephora]|uniref:Uncharacterized protein n=1 Tax=Coffea canephora TaxID=49390 RepID=A0A068V953_COFCA|nr:unnamed protein product [Coffea canephora]